uniref:Uncharacterized protein n=1 Tax=Podarcis muralis TaxID=64176 RepID=A0A670KK95_PODMU
MKTAVTGPKELLSMRGWNRKADLCHRCSSYVLQRVQKLQWVQNAAVRLLTGSSLWDHIHSVLYQLHWLPVEYRIRFKVLVLTFKALCSLGPSFLRDRLSAGDRLVGCPQPTSRYGKTSLPGH